MAAAFFEAARTRKCPRGFESHALRAEIFTFNPDLSRGLWLTVAAGPHGPTSHTGRAVDGLAEQVSVPVVACVLLYEVLQHPPHRHRHELEREGVVQLRAVQRGINGSALGPVALEVLLGAGRVNLFEVRVRGIGAVVQVGYLLTADGLPDPSALGVAHVPDQAEQREV